MNREALSEAALFLLRETGRRCYFKASGISMNPFIKEGMIIGVQYVPPETIRCGDIVVFKRSGKLVVHRVAEASSEGGKCYFVEKGEHPREGTIISEDDILGKVVEIKGESGIRSLEGGLWNVVNHAIGLYWRSSTSLFKAMQSLKRIFVGYRKTHPTQFLARLITSAISLAPRLLVRLASFFTSKAER
jgi:hypothetical protein